MNPLEPVPLRTGGVLRWCARGFGLTIALVFLFTLIAHAAIGDEPLTGVGIAIAVISVWTSVSLLAAWRWEVAGGVSSVLVGLTLMGFVYVTAGHNKIPAAVAIGLPVTVLGALFLVASHGRRADRGANGN